MFPLLLKTLNAIRGCFTGIEELHVSTPDENQIQSMLEADQVFSMILRRGGPHLIRCLMDEDGDVRVRVNHLSQTREDPYIPIFITESVENAMRCDHRFVYFVFENGRFQLPYQHPAMHYWFDPRRADWEYLVQPQEKRLT